MFLLFLTTHAEKTISAVIILEQKSLAPVHNKQGTHAQIYVHYSG